MAKRVLGKGLSSLLKEEMAPINTIQPINEVDIDLIYTNKDQPRKNFNDKKIQELAESIAIHGVLQPIIVHKDNIGKYKIIAGERRYRASKITKLKKIPIIIQNLNEKEIFEIALIENIQRDDLTAMEEAKGYQKLIDDYHYTQSDIATTVGKSRSHIANLLRLNHLPKSVQNMINEGKISMGHARCLVGNKNAEKIARQIVTKNLNVRKTEELVSPKNSNKQKKSKTKIDSDKILYKELDDDLIMLSESLSKKFGVKVIVENSNNGGRMSIYYDSLEDLDIILTKLD